VEEVCVVALKKDTFYALVKIRCSKKTCEIDARPSDAIALAVLNDVPIFVAEEVLETAGVKIPRDVKGSPNRKGLEKITKGLEEWQRQYQARTSQQRKRLQELSKEETAKRKEVFIASIFGK
jgi:bifunctional DNase/RNase